MSSSYLANAKIPYPRRQKCGYGMMSGKFLERVAFSFNKFKGW